MNTFDYKNNSNNKSRRLKPKIRSFINRILFTIIIFLSALIVVKNNPKIKTYLTKNVYEKSLKFTKIKSIYEKYFGKALSIPNVNPKEKEVFNEKLSYKKLNNYKDGIKLTVSSNYLVPNLKNGIVVFVGDKEEYGKTVIIEQTDGVDVWYSNINIKDIKLYDYVEKGKLVGEVINNKLYMVFQKDGKYIDYKEVL